MSTHSSLPALSMRRGQIVIPTLQTGAETRKTTPWPQSHKASPWGMGVGRAPTARPEPQGQCPGVSPHARPPPPRCPSASIYSAFELGTRQRPVAGSAKPQGDKNRREMFTQRSLVSTSENRTRTRHGQHRSLSDRITLKDSPAT